MLNRIKDGVGFIVEGVTRRSRQTIVLAFGGIRTVAERAYHLGARGLTHCWGFLTRSWFSDQDSLFYPEGNPEDLLEMAAQNDESRMRHPSPSRQRPPALIISPRISAPEDDDLLSPRRIAADVLASQDLQQGIQDQQRVLSGLLRAGHH